MNTTGIEAMSRPGAPKEGWYAVFLMSDATVKRVPVSYEDGAVWFSAGSNIAVGYDVGEEPDTSLHEIAGFFHDEFFPERARSSSGDQP